MKKKGFPVSSNFEVETTLKNIAQMDGREEAFISSAHGYKIAMNNRNVYRVIEDQVDLTVVGYGMGVRWSMHPPPAMNFRVIDLQKTYRFMS